MRRLGPPPAMLGFLAGAAAMFAVMYSTQAILPEIGGHYGVTPARAGLTVSALVLAIIPGTWLWGPLSDRIGRRRTLILSSALLVPVSLAVAAAPGFGWLVALRALQGLVMPGLLAVGVPYVSEIFVPRFGARVMGWYMAALICGGLVGRLGMAMTSALVGWRPALALVALMPLAATLLMRRTLPPAATPAARAGEAPRGRVERRLVGAVLAGPALFFAFVGTFTFVRFRLEAPPFDLGAVASSLVFLLWLLGALAPVAGRVTERHGWRWTALAGLGLALGGVALSLPDALPAVAGGLALVTAGMFIGSTAAQVALGGVREMRPGRASAAYYSVYYVAGALGAYLPGLAWQAAGWAGVAATAGAALAVALAGLAALGPESRPTPAARPVATSA